MENDELKSVFAQDGFFEIEEDDNKIKKSVKDFDGLFERKSTKLIIEDGRELLL